MGSIQSGDSEGAMRHFLIWVSKQEGSVGVAHRTLPLRDCTHPFAMLPCAFPSVCSGFLIVSGGLSCLVT